MRHKYFNSHNNPHYQQHDEVHAMSLSMPNPHVEDSEISEIDSSMAMAGVQAIDDFAYNAQHGVEIINEVDNLNLALKNGGNDYNFSALDDEDNLGQNNTFSSNVNFFNHQTGFDSLDKSNQFVVKSLFDTQSGSEVGLDAMYSQYKSHAEVNALHYQNHISSNLHIDETNQAKDFFVTAKAAHELQEQENSMLSQANDLAYALSLAGVNVGRYTSELNESSGVTELVDDEDDFFSGPVARVAPEDGVDSVIYNDNTSLSISPAIDIQLEAEKQARLNAAKSVWEGSESIEEIGVSIEELDVEESKARQEQFATPSLLSEDEAREAERYAKRDQALQQELFSLVEEDGFNNQDPILKAASNRDISFVALAEIDKVDLSQDDIQHDLVKDNLDTSLQANTEVEAQSDELQQKGKIAIVESQVNSVSVSAHGALAKTGTDDISQDASLAHAKDEQNGVIYEENGRIIELINVMPEKESFEATFSDYAHRKEKEGTKLLPTLLHDFGANFLVYGLAICACVLCLLKVYQVQETRDLTARLNEISLQNSALNKEWLNLVKDRQTLSEHAQIRKFATSKLNMVSPKTESEKVISFK